jgi:transcriptional regulator with XRE-family HTH domain
MKLNTRQLQIRMAEKVMTTKDLASKSGLSRFFIGDCLKGNTNPKPATVGKIARALDVPIQELIETGAATPENSK